MLDQHGKNVHFVLASASPRRKQLLAELGLQPEIFPVDLDETPGVGTPPQLVEDLARRKVEAAARRHPRARELEQTGRGAPLLMLASDTLVFLEEQPFSKPADRRTARTYLRSLSGRTHQVITALALHYQPPHHHQLLCQHACTHVQFKELSDRMIEDYLDTGEYRDKAGAYGIQGAARNFVQSLEGDFDTVVGLPRRLLQGMLAQLELRMPGGQT